MFKIIHEKKECIGCGACCSLSDEWEMDGMHATLLDSEKIEGREEKVVKEQGSHKDAAECCPVNCIHIEKDGERLI